MQPEQQPPQSPAPTPPQQPVNDVPAPAPQPSVQPAEQPPAYTPQPLTPVQSTFEQQPVEGQPEVQTEVSPAAALPSEESQAIQWQAPEYIQHARSPLWYVAFWGVVVVLMVIAFFVLRSWSFALLVPAMAAALMIYSHRPPRDIGYVLSQKGLYINDQLHPLEEFRNFGVEQEEAMPALTLIPVKRFRPGLTVHFPAESGEQIVDLLGGRLPMRNMKPDFFDKLTRKLRI